VSLKLFDKKTAQSLFTALIFAIVLLFLYSAWRAIIAFLFAIFFAYLLEAPVSRFQKWFRGSRGTAILAVYLIFIALLTIIFVIAGPPVIDEAQKLTRQAPVLVENISSGNLAKQLGLEHGWNEKTIDEFTTYVNSHKNELIATGQRLILGVVKSLQETWWLILVPILAIFFLKDGRLFAEKIVNSVENPRNRVLMAAIIEEMNTMLGHFIRSQLILSALAIVVVTGVLAAMRVPYAIALGPAAGAAEFIPVAGPVVGGLVIVAVAFMAGYNHVLWLVLFLLIWRGIQDYVSSPRIMGKTLELHPLTVLFGVFAGGEVAGVIGVFLSIPVMATLRILWHAWQFTRKTSDEKAPAPVQLAHD
jgi:predicted PurR-regulated permease PerM